MSFAIPASCPEKVNFDYKFLEERVDNTPDSPVKVTPSIKEEVASPSPKRGRGHVVATHEVETVVKRSLRIRDRNDGFKHDSCANRNCFACAALPPALDNPTIK